MNHLQGILVAKATPVPDINTQVVNELKDAAGTAMDRTNTFIKNLPATLTRLAIALAVLVAGLLLVKLIRFLIRSRCLIRRPPARSPSSLFLRHRPTSS